MKERPILFSSPMVRAILDGRKTQTRRVAKIENHEGHPMLDESRRNPGYNVRTVIQGIIEKCPYGTVGDRLWVRETHTDIPSYDVGGEPTVALMYKADFDYVYSPPGGWTPSIFMPRMASRITLEITNIRVERLQDISESDAKKEGVHHSDGKPDEYGFPTEMVATARGEFSHLWDHINGKKIPWDSNPWVWVIEFKRL